MTKLMGSVLRRPLAGRAVVLTAVSLCILTGAIVTLLAISARAQLGGGGGGGAPAVLPVGRDFDGDGFSDFLTPRPVASMGAPAGGTVRVYSGATRQLRFLLASGEPDDYFGVSVDSAGDVDGDDADDILIGAPRSQRGGVNAGAVYVFSGATGALLQEIIGLPHQRLGRAVAGLGDIDGDGLSDYAASSFEQIEPGVFVGAVDVFRAAATGVSLATIRGLPADPSFGAWVRGVGDVNGDGAVDLAIAAPREEVGTDIYGRVYIFNGDPVDPDTFTSCGAVDADAFVENDLVEVYDFGRFMMLGKDMDDDGERDLIIGTSYDRVSGQVRVRFRAYKSDDLSPLATSDPGPLWIIGDVNADLESDVEDVATTIEQIATEPDPLSPFNADADGDEVVTAADLAIIVAEMGTVHPLAALVTDKPQAAAELAEQMWRDGGGWCEGSFLGMILIPGLYEGESFASACCLRGDDPFASGSDGVYLLAEDDCGELDGGDDPEEPGPEQPGENPSSPNGPDNDWGFVGFADPPAGPIFDQSRHQAEWGEDSDGGDSVGSPGGGAARPDAEAGRGEPTSESKQSAELDREGAGEMTCDPVLIADGVKTDQAADLYVQLPGRDFELIRTYNAGALQQQPSFPWMIGNGWSTSADGWAMFRPRIYEESRIIQSETNFYDPFADAVEIVRFPVESSSLFYRDRVFSNLFKLFTPGVATVVRSTLIVRGESVPVWIYEESGKGQAAYYRTHDSGNAGLKALDGRILEQRDEFGNRWTYRYTTFGIDSYRRTTPRLSTVYLCGESNADALARIDFDWDVGTREMPGSGRVREASVMRRTAAGWTKTQYARYTYVADNYVGYYHLSQRSNSLVLVEQGVLVDAPAFDAPPSSGPLQYHVKFTHYRYSFAAKERMTHTFEPAHIERFAEQWPGLSGQTQAEKVRGAAHALMLLKTDDPAPGQAGLAVSDYASKIITYYGEGDPHPDDGYDEGALEGMVATETLQNKCGCSGGAGRDMRISFTYKRRLVMDHTLVWDLPEAWSSDPVIRVGRWSRVTIRKEMIDDGQGDWSLHRTLMNWSEDRPLGLGMVVLTPPPGSTSTFRQLATIYTLIPFVTANAIIEGEWNDPNARRWFTYHEFGDLNQPVRTYHPSAVEGVMVDPARALIAYPDESEVRFDLRPAIQFRPGGFVETFEYDAIGREIQRGVARAEADGDLDDEVVTRSTEYLETPSTPTLWGRRSDLVARVIAYPQGDAGAGSGEAVELSYGFDTGGGLRRDRVRWTLERLPREGVNEFGPNGVGFVQSAAGLTETGDPSWAIAPDGVVTIHTTDPRTGVVISTVSNAPLDTIDYLAPIAIHPPSDRNPDGGSLTTSRTVDVLGRPLSVTDQAGLTTSYRYGLGEVETTFQAASPALTTSRLPYFRLESRPHQFVSGGSTFSVGPAVVQWADASFKLLRTSSYEALPNGGLGDEVARTVHIYDLDGQLAQSRHYHDIAADLYYAEQFKYDALGRTIEATDAVGEVTRWEYDLFDRITSIHRGDGVTQQLVERRFYDHSGGLTNPVSGAGEGNLTLVQRPVGDGTTRSEVMVYDWRKRARLSYTAGASQHVAAPGAYSAVIYDNLDRPVEQATIGAGDLSAFAASLKADGLTSFTAAGALGQTAVERVSQMLYSARGLVYETRSLVFPSGPPATGQNYTPTGYRTRHWFDDAGRGLLSVGPDGAVAKVRYDGLGRVNRSVTTDGAAARTPGASFAAITSLDAPSETTFDETLTSFNARGLPELVTVKRRRHDAAPTDFGLGTNPIPTFAATVYDGGARPVATVSYGVDASPGSPGDLPFSTGGAPPSLPLAVVPARSDAVLVSETRYDAIGRPFQSIDTKGRVSRTLFDDLGRSIAMIDNVAPASQAIGLVRDASGAAAGLWSLTGYPSTSAADENRVVSMLYDGKSNMTHRIAHNVQPNGADKRQVTQYVYRHADQTGGVAPAFANHAISNNTLFEVRYPKTQAGSDEGLPGTAPEDIVRFGYNQLGEQISKLDQNGALFTYVRDALGRITSESVELTDGDAGLDTHAAAISTEFDGFGRMSHARMRRAGGTVLNEIRYVYDFLGRLSRLEQNPLGLIGAPGTRAVDFERSPIAPGSLANKDRLLAAVYPAALGGADRTRQELNYGAAGSSDALMGRVVGFSWQSHDAGAGGAVDTVLHQYVGLDRRISSVFSHAGAAAVARDRAFDPDTGATTPGVYPTLDRFGRVSRHVWTAGVASAPLDRPALLDLSYAYDWAGNITERLDKRAGAASNRSERYEHDMLNRLTAAARGESLGGALPGSEKWSLDRIGNWKSVEKATSQQAAPGSYDASEALTFNATNELTSSSSYSGAGSHFEYDKAGNLVSQRLPDEVDAQGAPVKERRRTLKYDPWGRLVRVVEQSRAPGAANWQSAATKTLAAYTYYAGNQRATRTARSARAPDQLDDPSSSDDDPDERTLFAYDADWHLLEEQTDLAYAGPWDRSGTTGAAAAFNTPPAAGSTRLTQYLWDPTSQDQLAQVLVREPDAAPGVPGETAAAWALTDRRHDVVALVGVGTLHSPAPIERVRYSAYGAPTWEVPGDITGDGKVDGDDVVALNAAMGSEIGDAAYVAEADLNLDGAVDAADLALLLDQIDQSSHRTALWDIACSVGYAGSLYDRATGLWLMRHRWYDPELGRWTTRDPAGYVDGSSLYMYVSGNPLTYWDPFGLQCKREWHHMIPQEFREEFEKAGIDIDDPRYGHLLNQRDHNSIHKNGEWNRDWRKWLERQKESGAEITKESVENQIMTMSGDKRFKTAIGRGAPAEQAYGKWRNMSSTAKNKAFRESRNNLGEKLSKVAGKKLAGAAAKKLAILAAPAFIVMDVADGKPLDQSIVDNVAPIDTDTVITLTDAGQDAVEEWVDSSRESHQEKRRSVAPGTEDLTRDVFSPERGPL